MKTTFNNRIAAIALAAIFTLSFTAPALASDDRNLTGVTFKFIGKMKNQPVLELSFNSAEEAEYIVEVVDEYNNVLYKDNVKASVGTKKFMLNTEELGTVGIRFNITGKKSNKTVVYEVNQSSRLVEDLVINQSK